MSMRTRLEASLRLKGDIGRLDLFVGLFVLALVASVFAKLWAGLWEELPGVIDLPELFLGIRVVFSLVVWSAVSLMCAARLRRLGWPQWLALLPVVSELFGDPLVIGYHILFGDARGFPLWLMIGAFVPRAATIVFLLMLLIWDERLANALSLRHRAVLLLAGFAAPTLWVAFKGGIYEAKLENFGAMLPTLTDAFLPLLPFTPYFFVGAVPSLLVIVSKGLPINQARLALSVSGAVFYIYLVWLWILWIGVVMPVNKMDAVVHSDGPPVVPQVLVSQYQGGGCRACCS